MPTEANPTRSYSIDDEQEAKETDPTELTRMLQDLSEALDSAQVHEQIELVSDYVHTCALVDKENEDANVDDIVIAPSADAVKNATAGAIHKRQFKTMYDSAKQELKQADASVSYAHEYTMQNTTSVQKIKNTDIDKESKYIFTLSTAEGETRIACTNEWKDAQAWTSKLDNRVEDIIELPECDTSEYVSQMRQAVEQNKTVSEVKGDRTRAVEMLLDRLENRDIVTDIDTAAMQDLIYVDPDKTDTIYAPSVLLSAVAESNDLNTNELHYQMDAMGMLTGSSANLSENGQTLRAWQINAEHERVNIDSRSVLENYDADTEVEQ